MTLHLGYIPANSTIYIPFHTFDSNGASVTITGLAVTDIEIYKNGGTTQRASDSGYTLLDTDGIDFDGLTGLHGFSIDLSDNTDSGFFAAGNHYMVAVSAITADSQTVSFWAATFYIGPQQADVVQLGSNTQSATDLKDFADTGYDPSAHKVQGVVLVDTTTTNTDMRGTDNAATASALSTMQGNVTDILADTNELQTDWTNGGRLDLILDARASQTSVDDIPTNTELTAAFTEIKGATWSTTDTLEAIRDRGDAAWITATGFSTHSAADVWAVATRVLTANTNLNDPTAAAIADAVWDEATAGHVSAGTFGKASADILADTNELQTNQGNWITATGFSTHSAADVVTALGTGSTLTALATQASVNTVAGYIDTEIGAIITNIAAVKSDTAAILLDTGTDGVVVATGSKTGYALTSAYDFAKGNVAMTEAYPTAGATMTPIETLYSMHQLMAEQSITSTTLTAKKRDQSTTAKTYILDSATTPTSITET